MLLLLTASLAYNTTCECATSDYLGLEAMCEPTLRVKQPWILGGVLQR